MSLAALDRADDPRTDGKPLSAWIKQPKDGSAEDRLKTGLCSPA
jgi:hypothetical protein